MLELRTQVNRSRLKTRVACQRLSRSQMRLKRHDTVTFMEKNGPSVLKLQRPRVFVF
jgi:hypothetical protein